MDPAAICDRLASLARSGFPVRAALIELPERIESDQPSVIAVARRARLGAPIDSCLEPLAGCFGEALPELRACLDRSSASGANWAAAVEALALSIRDRVALARTAEVAGAGATLSARIIAALPLLMLPMAVRQMSDAVVASSIGLGLLLGIAGYRWLIRVIPSPPDDDPAAVIADQVAAAVDAGSSFDTAVRRALLDNGGFGGVLRRARLGAPWRSALAKDLPVLAAAIADAERTGAPIALTLRRTAASLRQDARHRFERKVQRAPVRMVVPLVLCCLPAFVLIAIVPLLRGLAQPV